MEETAVINYLSLAPSGITADTMQYGNPFDAKNTGLLTWWTYDLKANIF